MGQDASKWNVAHAATLPIKGCFEPCSADLARELIVVWEVVDELPGLQADAVRPKDALG